MKARIPDSYQKGSSNPQAMVKQMQQMQADIATKQEELAEKVYDVTVGGGAVSISMNGKHEVTSVKLKPEVVDPEDTEMLEDLITSAVNEAIRTVDEDSDSEMNKITGSMPNLGSLPGLSGLF